MYKIRASNQFLKDLKLLKKRSLKDFLLLEGVVELLSDKGHKGVEKKYRAHRLSGNYQEYWECHIKPDLLLIWDEVEELMLIELVRTGTHSDLF